MREFYKFYKKICNSIGLNKLHIYNITNFKRQQNEKNKNLFNDNDVIIRCNYNS
jgi:hypothetical protein